MFLGSYESKVRDKNRLSFPAKFRQLTGDDLYITNWFENSLIIQSKKEWERFTKDLFGENSFLLPESRDLERFIYGGSFEVKLDVEGRFVIPQTLKEYARLGKNVIFVGGFRYISLWDLDYYNNYRTLNDLQIKDKAVRLHRQIKKR